MGSADGIYAVPTIRFSVVTRYIASVPMKIDFHESYVVAMNCNL